MKGFRTLLKQQGIEFNKEDLSIEKKLFLLKSASKKEGIDMTSFEKILQQHRPEVTENLEDV